MTVSVHVINVYKGPRHSRLDAYWRSVSYPHTHHAAPPGGATHYDMLDLCWAEAKRRPERYALITESDFLLFPEFLERSLALLGDSAILAPTYGIRRESTGEFYNKNSEKGTFPGAWYLFIDKERAPEQLDFTAHGRGYPDPANCLHEQTSVAYMPHEECVFPALWYPTGIHLFWSTHYNTPALAVGERGPRFPIGIAPAGLPHLALLSGIDALLEHFESHHPWKEDAE